MQYYAHSLADRPQTDWEPLYTGSGEGHLERVAALAEEFASKFDAGPWGRLAGLWHDLGKYSTAFQDYLLTQNGFEAHVEQQSRVDHSTAGAQHADRTVPVWGRLLAYCIAGHHAGLADAVGGQSGLGARLTKPTKAIDAAPAALVAPNVGISPPDIAADGAPEMRVAFQLAFFTRMLFSCLVDADFLATETFMNPARSADRPSGPKMFQSIKLKLDRYAETLANPQLAETKRQAVHQCRQEVLAACRAAAKQSQKIFSLTVPAGGGKTVASLAFALDHVIRHDLDRIIYAIPFTSIIEQTAGVFRKILHSQDADIVLEHHSNLDPDSRYETPRSRLAAENWDAPLVVTTNVQLFESLFASRTSRCRKLHNLVGSVIILDESQTLPVELLRPVLAAMRELVTDYRCTVLLCTATQPALESRDEFPIGLQNVYEIIPDPPTLYRRMKRVEVHSLGRVTDRQLIVRLLESPSFLAIVNTRPHAARLFCQLREQVREQDGLFHLSTYLCGQHRSELLHRIRMRLAAGLPCRVISTQLVEAGVDVDFPVVFRAMTGLDSLAQAAGRCNREGKLSKGVVYLFDPIECQPKSYLGSIAATAREVIPDFVDLLDQRAIEQYFRLHYWKRCGDNRWDDHRVMECFPTPAQRFAFNFRSASERFRMIEDATRPVFVPFERGRALIEQLRSDGPSRGVLRRLQRFSVGLYEQAYAQLVGRDIEELPNGGYSVLINENLYDARLGLRIDLVGHHEPESLIA